MRLTVLRRRRSRGISTMELLVGSTLSMVVLGAMHSAFRFQSRSFAAQSTYSQSQNVTRTVIDLMTREIRMAAYDPSDTAMPSSPCTVGKQGILEATPTRLRFRQDFNGDGDVADDSETVTYELLAGDITRQDRDHVPVVLASGVGDDGLTFRYFDINHTELVPSLGGLSSSQRDCVTKVSILAHADIEVSGSNATDGASYPSVAESEVAIRNLSLINF